MTLANFKNHLKISVLALVVLVYSISLVTISHNLQKFNFNFLKKSQQKNDLVQPVSKNAPYSDSQSANVISSYVKLCSNTLYSFEVSYPKDWFTTYNSENEKCSYFAPFSFVIPQNPDYSFVPVKIEVVDNEKWLETVKFYQNPNDFQNVLESQNIQISDNSVIVVKAQTTGNGSLPRGQAILSYLIFSNSNPLILSYNQIDPQENTKLYEDVLSQMANSLRFF